jgi:hypothetical protein
MRAALAQARLELLDLGREVLGDGDAGAGLGGEVEDDVVEDLLVAQLLKARVRAKVAEVELAERGPAVEAPERLRDRLEDVELACQRAEIPRGRLAGGVGEQGIALQRADILGLLGERRVDLALQFFEVSPRPLVLVARISQRPRAGGCRSVE